MSEQEGTTRNTTAEETAGTAAGDTPPKGAGDGTGAGGDKRRGLGFLLGIPVRVSVELGATKMTIREILAVGEGSVIELEKLAGEPMDILVNGRLIARGEVVAVDEKYGVRVVEIATPEERLRQFR